MKPWMTRIESNAMAAMRQLRCASVMAGACSAIRSRVVACMFTFVSYVAKSRDSIGWRLASVRLEPVALEDRQLLEHRFGLPCDTGVGTPLHQKQRRLTMVDMGEDGAAVGHLGLVDRVGERLPPCRFQRRLDLPRNSLEFRVRHGETNIRLPKIGAIGHVAQVALGYHNRERISDVRH